MQKRAIIVLSATILTMVSLAVGLLYYLYSYPGPSEFSFSKIHPGMTVEEVEAILGPGQEVDHVPQTWRKGGLRGVVEGERILLWTQRTPLFDGEERFYISFSGNKVLEKHHSASKSF